MTELTDAQKDQLRDALTNWYYRDGGAMFLSHKSVGLFLQARKCLSGPSLKPGTVHDRFSKLRTELKIDLGIYKPEERNIPVDTNSSAPEKAAE